MLQINLNPTFDMPVTVSTPALSAVFGITFKLLDLDAVDALRAEWLGLDAKGQPVPATPGQQGMKDVEFMHRVVAGWRDVSDAAGPVKFAVEKIEHVARVPGVASAVISAFFAGYRPAEAKNSAALPAA